jgi:hypothetical protein
VARDDATGCYMLSITEDKQEGKSLKTASSWRTVPVHPELTRLGFLDLVEAAIVPDAVALSCHTAFRAIQCQLKHRPSELSRAVVP